MIDSLLLRNQLHSSLLTLSSDDGITASARNEAYGCIFGRDSAITILKILKVHENYPVEDLLQISKKTILTLVELQGKASNIESGEQPGKFIHEFRKTNYERLINRPKPWYVYPDGYLRNYDSLDATPLLLLAIYKYWEATADGQFLLKTLPAVEKGLNWIITYGDLDKDFLVEYELPEKRKYGGLAVQSWTDSHESLRDFEGNFPDYPIAPVEVQGYTWLALKLWSDFFINTSQTNLHKIDFARSLNSYATNLKKKFNETFIFKSNGLFFASQALDGKKQKIKTVTGNPLLLLWAGYKNGSTYESIIDDRYIPDIVERSFQNDLFEKDAGIRTMSTKSKTFNPNVSSYHNGSFWPKLNGMCYEGLLNFKFNKHAELLKNASIKPFLYFKTPIELYMKNEGGQYKEYLSSWGKMGCRNQAWSAASLLHLVTSN